MSQIDLIDVSFWHSFSNGVSIGEFNNSITNKKEALMLPMKTILVLGSLIVLSQNSIAAQLKSRDVSRKNTVTKQLNDIASTSLIKTIHAGTNKWADGAKDPNYKGMYFCKARNAWMPLLGKSTLINASVNSTYSGNTTTGDL